MRSRTWLRLTRCGRSAAARVRWRVDLDVFNAIELAQAILNQPRTRATVHAFHVHAQFALAIRIQVAVAATGRLAVNTCQLDAAGREAVRRASELIVAPQALRQMSCAAASQPAQHRSRDIPSTSTALGLLLEPECRNGSTRAFDVCIGAQLIRLVGVLEHHIGGMHRKIGARKAGDDRAASIAMMNQGQNWPSWLARDGSVDIRDSVL